VPSVFCLNSIPSVQNSRKRIRSPSELHLRHRIIDTSNRLTGLKAPSASAMTSNYGSGCFASRSRRSFDWHRWTRHSIQKRASCGYRHVSVYGSREQASPDRINDALQCQARGTAVQIALVVMVEQRTYVKNNLVIGGHKAPRMDLDHVGFHFAWTLTIIPSLLHKTFRFCASVSY
jgi:hypothetical protein